MSYKENYVLINWAKPIRVRSKKKGALARSRLPFPMVMSDCMDPIQSMLDGKYYTSKSALRATYKAAGCVEVGNDPARLKPRAKPKPNRRQIRDVIESAFARLSTAKRPKRR